MPTHRARDRQAAKRGTTQVWFVLMAIVLGVLLGVGLGPTITEYLGAATQATGDSTPEYSDHQNQDQNQDQDQPTQLATDKHQVEQLIQSATSELRAELQALKTELAHWKQEAESEVGGSDGSAADASHAVARPVLSDEIQSLRTHVRAELKRLSESVEPIAELKTHTADLHVSQQQTLAQLKQLERTVERMKSTADRLDQFVQAEMSERDRTEPPSNQTIQTQRPNPQPASRPQKPMGKLIMDSNAARVIPISINGRREQLRPGRNTFMVKIGSVDIQGGGKRWLLDVSLWKSDHGEQMLHWSAWAQ